MTKVEEWDEENSPERILFQRINALLGNLLADYVLPPELEKEVLLRSKDVREYLGLRKTAREVIAQYDVFHGERDKKPIEKSDSKLAQDSLKKLQEDEWDE